MNIEYHYKQAPIDMYTVVFINGLLENKTSWEQTDKGKHIHIISKMKKKCSVLTFDFTHEHYKMDFIKLVNMIDDIIKDKVKSTKIIMVGHSIGGLITQVYGCLYPHKLKGIILIDSSTLNEFFKQRIIRDKQKCIDMNEIEIYDHWLSSWLSDFTQLPDISKISSNIIVIAHLNIMSDYTNVIKHFYNNDYELFYNDHKQRFKYYKSITTRNCHSKTILHMDASHFIHYTNSEKIVDSIYELV